MRNTLLTAISHKLEKDENLIVLLGDLGVFQMREAMRKYPSRVINFGIMEQTMVGFAAGVARNGCYPILYSITPFIIDRAFEQVKIDLLYNQNPALILAAGGSYDYSTLGPTHHCQHDVSSLLSIGYPYILHPFTKDKAVSCCLDAINHRRQSFLRISSSELDLTKYCFEKVHPHTNIDGKLEPLSIELYSNKKQITSKATKAVALFGPDSVLLNDSEKYISEAQSVFEISAICEASLTSLLRQTNQFSELILLIPYEPSGIVMMLLKLISEISQKPVSLKCIYPKQEFFDHSYEKNHIFKLASKQISIF